MFLAVDIGNSRIKLGAYEGSKLVDKVAISPVQARSGGLRPLITSQFPPNISSVCIASVVPEYDELVGKVFTETYGLKPVILDTNLDVGLDIDYDARGSLGIDRLVDAYAAAEKYGEPVIVCDLGTATTIDVVDQRTFKGGIIVPGMQTMADSLNDKTSRLPPVAIVKPDKILGTSTVGSIISGIYFGYLGLVDGIISRMRVEIDGPVKVVATGGFARMIAADCESIDTVDEDLMLDGIRLIYERSVGPSNR